MNPMLKYRLVAAMAAIFSTRVPVSHAQVSELGDLGTGGFRVSGVEASKMSTAMVGWMH